MRQKLFNFNNRFVKFLFYFFFTLTFGFALTSPNLILGDNHITKIGTTGFTTLVLIIAGIIGIVIYDSKKVRRFLHRLFITNQWITARWCLGLAILIQIGFVLIIHPAIGFDVGGVHEGLLHPNDPNVVGYFSVNTNNVNIMLLQHWLATQFGTTSWLFIDLCTVFFVDISAALNLLSITAIDKSKVPLGMYIHAAWLSIFPAIIVPYTDTWALPYVSLYILCYCVIGYTKAPKIVKAAAALVFGVGVSAAYFIKPSAVIPAIAIILIELMTLLKPAKRQWWWIGIVALLLTGSTAASYQTIHKAVQNQTYIRVYAFRAKPMVHFINMGLSGDGGYNAKDSFKMVTTMSKKARIDYSVNSIKKRLRKMGPIGYLKFLFQKQKNNVSDGTFAWVQDGDFIPVKHIPDKTGFKGWLEDFLLLYGTKLGDFRFFAQIWWCIWLALIFFAWHDNRKITQVMRLALIGGFIFLLIFEGGRSRYLIQFIPVLTILATLGGPYMLKTLTSLFKWAQHPTKSAQN